MAYSEQEMMNSPVTLPRRPPRLSVAAAGAMYCLVAVLGYSAANACMTKLSKESCVSTWAICNKELITVLVVGPFLAWQIWLGKSRFPTGRPLLILVAAGLACELIGNIGTQWGYGVVGLAVMIPANTGFLLVATAILGAILLGERVSGRNAAVVALLILALVVLGYGISQSAPAQTSGPQVAGATAVQKSPLAPWQIAAAIGVAGLCGTVYALLAIALRYTVSGNTTLSAAVVIITGIGVLTLGPLSLWQAGPHALAATPAKHYALMYAAGVCNLFALIALIRGLQVTTALHINVLNNAGQVSLATIVGVLLFGEPCNRWLVLGVALMIAGIFAIGPPVEDAAIEAPV
jgi:drug/metabolite transporter (DMT)-like permease